MTALSLALPPTVKGFAPSHISAMVNSSVVATHVSEAAFLWRLRQGAAKAPHYNLAHLSRLDDRLEAHLQALPLAGDIAKRLADLALEDGDTGPLFVATWLASARGDVTTMSRLGALASAEPAFGEAVGSALTWRPVEQVEPLVHRLLASKAPPHRTMALRVLLDRRLHPHSDLTAYLGDATASVRTLAAALVGALKRSDDLDAVRVLLSDPDADVQLAAARTLALLGDAEANSALIACARVSTHAIDVASQLLVHRLDLAEARSWIRSLTQSESTLRQGIRATGMLGDSRAAEWLIALMEDPKHARIAGEAFALMTGADLDPMTLRRDPPEDFDADADPFGDEDGELGWPDAGKIKRWWTEHRSSMPFDRRYLCGRPITLDMATDVLRYGYQRQRAQAAIELALLSPAAIEFPVQAPGAWQGQRLAA